MPVIGKDAVQIGRIRRAGLGRVREAALRDGLKPERVQRDFAVLKAVANGGTAAAADKFRVTRKPVWYALKKYEGYANTILDNDKRRGRNDAAAECKEV